MPSRRRLLGLAGLFAAGLAGCSSPTEENGVGRADPGPEPETPDSVPPTLVTGIRAFGCDLLGLLDDENLCFSPYSISLALAMAFAGAEGETREAMTDALRYQLDGEELHGGFAALEAELAERADADTGGNAPGDDEDPEDEPFTLRVANAAWGQDGYPFADAYLKTLDDNYGAGLREADFCADHEGERDRINAWVADETEDQIEELLPEDSLDDLTRLVLTNAVYFEASWRYPFDEAQTEPGTFTTAEGDTQDVRMMRRSGSYPYAVVDGHEVVELPYAGNEVGMLLVLPDGDLAGLQAELDGSLLAAFDDALEGRDGAVELPRFEFDAGFELGEGLSELGMEVAFDEEEGNFEGMVEDERKDTCTGYPAAPYIDDVYHDAFISVDEVGTEAAAATAVVVAQPVSADPNTPEPFEFVADRPFLYVIRDRPTGAPLFFGRVGNAATAQE